MLPMMCRKPPWRNMDVNTASHENAAGIRPKIQDELLGNVAERPFVEEHGCGTTTAIRPNVTYGVVREGMMSRRGIMSGYVGYRGYAGYGASGLR